MNKNCVAAVWSHHTLMCPVSGYSCELSLTGNPTHSGRLFFFAQLQIIQRRQKLEQIANIPLKIFSIELLQILNSSYWFAACEKIRKLPSAPIIFGVCLDVLLSLYTLLERALQVWVLQSHIYFTLKLWLSEHYWSCMSFWSGISCEELSAS